MQNTNELYELTLRKKELKISIKENLSCILWGKYWGVVHKIFEDKEYGLVKIDLSHCYWSDPIPLLSILLELIHIKEDYQKSVRIILPRLDSKNENNANFIKGRFLKFLASQGFLKIMLDNFDVANSKGRITEEKIVRYSNYNNSLIYNEAEVVLAKIYDLSKSINRESILEKFEEEFLFRFKNTVSLQTYFRLAEHVYNILNELIENVERHAYQLNEEKRFAVYIRRRYGAVKNYGEDKQSLDVLRKEKYNCPALDNQVLLDNEAILEIFFVDIGMGLKESLREFFIEKQKHNYKYPVRELFCKILRDGVRKEKDGSLTPFGGLHFITRILRENKGYIWCNEGKEWICSSSVGLLNNDFVKVAITNDISNLENVGLSWCFRIPYSDISKSKNTIGYTWKETVRTHPVFITFQTIETNMDINRVFCRDDRIDKCIWMNGDIKTWDFSVSKKLDSSRNFNISVDTYVWFPKAYYSKNLIIRKLKDYMEKIINKGNKKDEIYLIIGEIDSNELISYYYALNNILLTILGGEGIESIILVTKKWEVVCLQKVDKHLRDDAATAENFYYKEVNNSSQIHHSIVQYAKFIRKYDSYLFWNLVKEYQKNKIYINANIRWNNETVINGYLDFEKIYLFEDVYTLLRNALFRTSGFVSNVDIEYRFIDYASSRICQDVNMNNIYMEHQHLYPINVGGACATGYTKESFYRDKKVDVNIIFFAHSIFGKKINDTAFLFIWPKEDFFLDFEREQREYYRLGKTNLITSNRDESLIDVQRVYNNAIRNKKQTYVDFQNKYPKFIKYGHYKTDKHHYLIGFDILTYMRYSYTKKEGAFVYILWKIINYLCSDTDNIYTYIKDKEWCKTLQYCEYRESIEQGEVLVYHSNTFTEYIIKLVKEVLPDFLIERIVPINIIEVQPKGAPITFSPFTLDILRKIFANNDRKGILYMDSSFSTGRKMMEIENILLSTGCQKVSFLSVFDMRRLRNEDVGNFSYWKINLPRLDDDTHCIICGTLEKVRIFRDKVDGEMNYRIQEWLKNWSCMSVLNFISGHGIENVEGIQCNIDSIPINNSNALNIIIAEKLCESYSNDFVYRFINKKTDLSIYIKMQLICTQICLYGNQNSRQLQLSLLSELVGNMAKSNTINPYTSLAGIVLISQPESIIYELLKEILYLNTNPKILSVKKFFLNSENIDLIISIGYFVKNSYKIEQLVNGYESSNGNKDRIIKLINMHLLPEKDLKLISKEFEGILVNEQGRRHNTNIQKLLSEHVTDFYDLKERCQRAQNDIDRLYELSKHFPLSLSNSREKLNNVKLELDDAIIQTRNLFYKEEEENNEILATGLLQQITISEELKSAINKCKNIFHKILNGYFIQFSDETKNYFMDLVLFYQNKYEKDITIEISNNVNIKDCHKWYYWNQGIEKEFKYLLENIEHCEKLYNNAYMKVNITFEYNYVLIKIISWSDKTADIVKNTFLSKNRLSKERSIAFDVIFDFHNMKVNQDGEFLLETQMSIPACYQQLKGD